MKDTSGRPYRRRRGDASGGEGKSSGNEAIKSCAWVAGGTITVRTIQDGDWGEYFAIRNGKHCPQGRLELANNSDN